MWSLLQQLTFDETGSSVTTEMSLVTGVTVAALFMSMGSVSNNVSHRFGSVANSSALSANDTEKKREEHDKARREEFERLKAEAARQRAERQK